MIEELGQLEKNYHNHDGINSPKVINPMFNLARKSVQSGVVANVGSTQPTATKLLKDVVEIATCANAGDSVLLPYAVQGLQILIINHGANSCDVFPNVGDSINEGAVDTAKALAANASMLCTAYDNTNFECLTMAR